MDIGRTTHEAPSTKDDVLHGIRNSCRPCLTRTSAVLSGSWSDGHRGRRDVFGRPEAIRVAGERDIVRKCRVSVAARVWIRTAIAIDANGNIELQRRAAGRECDARLDIALLSGTTESVAAAEDVVARHALDAIGDRHADVSPDRNTDANAGNVLVGH